MMIEIWLALLGTAIIFTLRGLGSGENRFFFTLSSVALWFVLAFGSGNIEYLAVFQSTYEKVEFYQYSYLSYLFTAFALVMAVYVVLGVISSMREEIS